MDRHSEEGRALTPESWAAITDLFAQAIELHGDARRHFLEGLETRDPGAAREIACLLDEHERPGEFLTPVSLSSACVTDLSGTNIGDYLLVRLIGSGGMGAVYLGERSDGAFSKHVAVKVLSTAVFYGQEQFELERECLARLDHPNITRLLDGDTTPGGLPYLVIEYVEGLPIDRYCAEQALSLDATLRLLLQVCGAIGHAHQHLIIHSDIKPQNILVTADGVVKMLDFGIATLRGAARVPAALRAVTPAYSSPEQLLGAPLTTASDVYAIGVLAYQLLTGGPPYALDSNDLGEMLYAVLNAAPIRASAAPGVQPLRARDLRGDLDAILARAVAKDADQRYATAQQLADDIERHRAGLLVPARAATIP
jgi:serine/threonine protein kinase